MRPFLVSPLLPSFVTRITSPRNMGQLLVAGGREPRDWLGCTFAINDLGKRGELELNDRAFEIEWTDEIVPAAELQQLMTKRLSVLGWKPEAFAADVSLIQNVADFDRVYRQFPDRAERAGWVKGCLYSAFVTAVVVIVVLWRFRRVVVQMLP